MTSEWEERTLQEAVEINPPRMLAKGATAPYIAMESLIPFQRRADGIMPKVFAGSGSRFRNGDTLLARITPCLENGKTAFVSELPNGVIGYGSTEFIVLGGKEGRSDNLFIYYLARDPAFRTFAIQLMEGSSGRQRVPASALGRLRIELPPLAEQRAIAAILGALDDKIELSRRMNETLEAMAGALFKSWFVDFEPFQDQGMEDSPLGPIPGGWVAGNVEQVAELYKKTITPNNYPAEVFCHYSIPAFDEGRTPKPERGDEIKSNKVEVPTNAVLISKLNPRFPRIWLPCLDSSKRSICSTEFLVVLPKETATREYLYCLFSSSSFFGTFSSFVTGTSSSHQRIRPEDLLSMRTVIPPRECTASFSERARLLFQRVQASLDEAATLAAIRDALLPKLLSGRIRVKDADKFVERAV